MIKINFIWSFIYEQTIHNPSTDEKFNYEEYEQFVNSFIKKVRPTWEEIERKIFDYCEEITGLKWKKREIPVYVIKISSFMPISDPLTIPIQFKDNETKHLFTLTKERFIDMLIHELIHNLFIQNEKEMGNYFDFILKKYEEEEFDTAIHLLVHSIHKKIFLRFFDKKRLDEEIEMSSFYPAYKRSWRIVNEKGEDSIINEFKNYIAGMPKEKA